MRYFYYIVLFFVFQACSHNQQNNNSKNISFNKNDSILITYFCGAINTDVAIRCEELMEIQKLHSKNNNAYVVPEEFNNKNIDDSSLEGIVLEQLSPELVDTFIVDNTVIDRIIQLLDNRKKATNFSEDARMYVTIQQKNGNCDFICIDYANRFKYNDKACSMDGELVFLLRYYSGYYLWFEESYLDSFEELQDTLFYQKALEQIKLSQKTI